MILPRYFTHLECALNCTMAGQPNNRAGVLLRIFDRNGQSLNCFEQTNRLILIADIDFDQSFYWHPERGV